MCKISIIIPLYNAKDYIEECLTSITELDTNLTVECLIVDDKGNDGSVEIAERFIKNSSSEIEFRILHHEKNRGAAAARNTGIDSAKGEYIIFVDSDDRIMPDSIAIFNEYLTKYSDAEVIQCLMRKSDDGGIFGEMPIPCSLEEYCTDGEKIIDQYLYHHFFTSPCGKLIKRSFLIDNQLYFHEGIIQEDVLWHFFTAKVLTKLVYVPEVVYEYNIRENSVTTDVRNDEKRFNSQMYILKTQMQNITPVGLSRQKYDLYDKFQYLYHLNRYNPERLKSIKQLLWSYFGDSTIKLRERSISNRIMMMLFCSTPALTTEGGIFNRLRNKLSRMIIDKTLPRLKF